MSRSGPMSRNRADPSWLSCGSAHQILLHPPPVVGGDSCRRHVRGPIIRLMIRRHTAAFMILLAAGFAARLAAQAPAFKVDKYDIKGEGGTDYVAVEPATGRVFVSRANHMMVVEGATGKVLGDIPNTPGVHGAGIVTKAGHGFTTNGGDETVTMFDLKTLAVI